MIECFGSFKTKTFCKYIHIKNFRIYKTFCKYIHIKNFRIYYKNVHNRRPAATRGLASTCYLKKVNKNDMNTYMT
ncbi:hypothetical protein HanRHA438_Chr01g0039121 [Helianthus annuus]|nr:hypothetical protein HanRHA438_Chr01g0039121 [Helianthus annuus]